MLKLFTFLMAVLMILAVPVMTSAQTAWTKYEGNPVVDLGEPLSWDSGSLLRPFVIYDGEKYQMWFSGNKSGGASNARGIGYATSDDGVSWTKTDSINPVLNVGPPGSWDDAGIFSCSVHFDGTTYEMWYAGSDGSRYRIGYATSANGISWTKADSVNPVLDVGPAGTWDSADIRYPWVLFEGTAYQMWYGGRRGSIWRIGHATSPDGLSWTKNEDNPVLDAGPAGSWDDVHIAVPSVLHEGSVYEMFYGAADQSPSSGGTFRIGYATSEDGIEWKKAVSENPVLDVGPTGSWDSFQIGHPSVLIDERTYKMWYIGADASDRVRIGYATSAPLGIEDGQNVIPSFTLHQNYPNPFNPVTTLRYDLPQASEVTLTIYDILGRQVRTLVQGMEEPGHKSVTWDGTDDLGEQVGAGICLYRIQAGEFAQTRKMIHLR